MADSSLETEKKTCLINKSTRQAEFLVIDNNGYIRDTRLSLKAKGALTLMLTNKSDWVIHLCEIVRHSRDGVSALSSAFKELIAYKYMIKSVERDEKGHFIGTTYYIYDEPFDGSPIESCTPSESVNAEEQQVDNPKSENPKSDNPVTENPIMAKSKTEIPETDIPIVKRPKTGNRMLTNNNLNKKNSKQTNVEHPDLEESEEVSLSDFSKTIKELFSGKNPFPENFEKEVLDFLHTNNIDDNNVESYLRYVFERAKQEKVKKSFVGLYYKMALSDSIVADFHNSNIVKKNAEKKHEPVIEYITCPICGSQVEKYGNECPTCRTEVRVLRNNKSDEFMVANKVWRMTTDEKDAYEKARSDYENDTKTRTGKTFLTNTEYLEFWNSYGLLDSTAKNKEE